jgi:hypothetical protein
MLATVLKLLLSHPVVNIGNLGECLKMGLGVLEDRVMEFVPGMRKCS